MEKSALNAYGLRQLVATLSPAQAIKRIGKRRYDQIYNELKRNTKTYPYSRDAQYNDLLDTFAKNTNPRLLRKKQTAILRRAAGPHEVSNALKLARKNGMSRQDYANTLRYLRGSVPESSIAHLYDPYTMNNMRELRNYTGRQLYPDPKYFSSRKFPTFFQENNIISKDELLNRAAEAGQEIPAASIKHSHYYWPADATKEGVKMNQALSARASVNFPFTDTVNMRPMQAALTDTVYAPSWLETDYIGNALNVPRSVQKALDIVRGQNVLEPGTKANRLYRLVKNNPNIMNRLSDKVVETGENAFFDSNINAIWSKMDKATELHERGHMAAANMPMLQHADEAKKSFRSLNAAAKKHNLDVPFDDPELMQEAFAESYRMRRAPMIAPRPYLTDAEKHISEAIGSLPLRDLDKEMLRQLSLNYQHPIFK